jgi:hypothetical protein
LDKINTKAKKAFLKFNITFLVLLEYFYNNQFDKAYNFIKKVKHSINEVNECFEKNDDIDDITGDDSDDITGDDDSEI